ncbi:hypothetical protein L596_011626 [Steinernema carpocapsae]|uniref:long-chain-fatty-acid--CoA ligase n=1 Tax=Steinernema carpocapsae TaxID=34508 RepID=A0A4U5NUY3_STECR|nr:hypothetical protein L596_011626 [Steinernema carpocapsae]
MPNSYPNFERYSEVLPGDERIHQNSIHKELLTKPPNSDVTTMFELLRRGVTLTDNGDCVGEQVNGSYSWTRYQTVVDEAEQIGSGLMELGLKPGQETRVGVAALNCREYIIAMHGIASYSMVLVPLYHNYKFEAVCEIVNSCKMEVIFCDTSDRAKEYLENMDAVPTLKKIIVMKPTEKLAHNDKIQILEWNYMLRVGEANLRPPQPPTAEDIYIICHTSGTTGTPKGVQLSHRALLASMGGLYAQWCIPPHDIQFGPRDVYLSFLSLAHIYEQLMEAFIMFTGGRIGFFCGEIKNLISDMQLLKPTMANINSANFLKRFLFRQAVKSKQRALAKGHQNYNTIWDKLVFKKLHAMFGGNLRLITTGGAPITPQVMNFSRVAYGCPVFEGYGQTECSAAGNISLPFDTEPGHVGGPSSWAQVKLIDVPELGYLSNEDRGEVCFRGAGLMTSYYNEPKLTAEAVDSEGWLHTGDIGMWLPNGALRIIDRKKHFFKLAQGDFVSPEQVENVYVQHPLINQIFVDGHTTQTYLIAIAVVSLGEIKEIAAQKQLKFGEDEDILSNSAVRNLVVQELRIFGASKGLNSLEQIKNITLITEEFTAENGLLTVTLKIRRHQMKRKFEKVIVHMYSETVNF